jgi:hypothetical protein
MGINDFDSAVVSSHLNKPNEVQLVELLVEHWRSKFALSSSFVIHAKKKIFASNSSEKEPCELGDILLLSHKNHQWRLAFIQAKKTPDLNGYYPLGDFPYRENQDNLMKWRGPIEVGTTSFSAICNWLESSPYESITNYLVFWQKARSLQYRYDLAVATSTSNKSESVSQHNIRKNHSHHGKITEMISAPNITNVDNAIENFMVSRLYKSLPKDLVDLILNEYGFEKDNYEKVQRLLYPIDDSLADDSHNNKAFKVVFPGYLLVVDLN